MTLNPIRIVDRVIDEYRDYVRTEFRAKDPGLREALERELGRPLFLAQEPFYQAHRPFKSGKRWKDLALDPKLARVMERRSGSECAYIHQSDAIDRLLGSGAGPLVVTTGTGSGKTECFLLPVIQNALEDAARFRKAGLTAILVYPMNALANDQQARIEEYLRDAGMSGAVEVARYDRGTTQAQRQALRRNPPHILLTNYMMLEYLLVRPADRDDIFANHRCRFLVLDEVHTYRGTLGANIALLIRRLRAHLRRARQDWGADAAGPEKGRRFPTLLTIGTSATIKSVAGDEVPPEERTRLRDEAVQGFFGKIAGEDPGSIRVLGEQIEEIREPADAAMASGVSNFPQLNIADLGSLQSGLAALAGVPTSTPLAEAASRARILWLLNRWLVRAPMSVSQMVDRLRTEVPERRETDTDALRSEVEAALLIGSALPEGTPGALRLRAHRLLRGGWAFHRCVDPDCGRVYPMGESKCDCGRSTAPLMLCRNCGADYLRLAGEPASAPLRPWAAGTEAQEWLLYEPTRFTTPIIEPDDEETEEDDEPPTRRTRAAPTVTVPAALAGSFDPSSLAFSVDPTDYRTPVTLSPTRTKCLCCGGTAGNRPVITPVSLGTSAAVKVIGEGLIEALADANRDRPGHDGKERLLVFADSRQDASHQARFILSASRYDRMRRRVVQILGESGPIGIQRLVELLGDRAVAMHDNPHVPSGSRRLMPEETARIRAWEEAPLLDDIAVTSGYRGTLLNLGLVGVRYQALEAEVGVRGKALAGALGLSTTDLAYVARCLLDEMRRRIALGRDMLRYNPAHASCPSYVDSAQWERRIRRPAGYALSREGTIVTWLDPARVPDGIKAENAWRRDGKGGRDPSLARILKHLVRALGGGDVDADDMVALLELLADAGAVVPFDLFGFRERYALLQVNPAAVVLELTAEETRLRCEVCGAASPFAPLNAPCPRCHGRLIRWPDAALATNRSVRRIRSGTAVPLVAGEHTAQVPNDRRLELEEAFKASPKISPVNVLACSPTLEMGIDVGGLDAILLRNVPPRPDNYAQRGGRAGRRTRVGLVIGYARRRPHDQYFYERPAEMISGEVPAPALALGNRDVIHRHVNAIVFGAAEPGLSGRMVDYVTPTGGVNEEKLKAFIDAARAKVGEALDLAVDAFGPDVIPAAGLSRDDLERSLTELPDRIRDVVERTARQVHDLHQTIRAWATDLLGARASQRAGELIRRILGMASERGANQPEADDRSAGYPMRRFAEFGILPGYEFPSEPAALRLLGDDREEEPVTVARRFGLSQFQPEALVYARSRRWKVIGLDSSSPWNPQADVAPAHYRICRECDLRYRSDLPRCGRCGTEALGLPIPAAEYGGFLAKRDEHSILDEEDRLAAADAVSTEPQWDGDVVGRWLTAAGWSLRLSRGEEIQWINEGLPPSKPDIEAGHYLHPEAKGFSLCPACGAMLTIPPDEKATKGKSRRAPRTSAYREDRYGHRKECNQAGSPPKPVAISTSSKAEVLRLLVPVPSELQGTEARSWGLSLGYALRIGMRHLYMLDGPEIEFELEGPWTKKSDGGEIQLASLSFIDPSLGGTGYASRIAAEFHLVARRAIDHLEHAGCETACYRCLKSYANQRFHDLLRWPLALPSLESLAADTPVTRPLETGDLDDPRPWLEAFAAGVGSPLELKFLRLFEKHGFHPQKQVPVAVRDGDAAISIADFAVPERRLAIYIDGASFHVGANLRRDRQIRERLRNGDPPWRIEELRVSDLALGAELLRRLGAEPHPTQ